jgi:type IV pilus assembly protein PilQ
MKKAAERITAAFLALWLMAGCVSTGPAGLVGRKGPPSLVKAEALFAQEHYTDALIECIDLAREDEIMPGLSELRNRIMVKLNERRSVAAGHRSASTYKRMDVDVDQRKHVPETYGLKRTVEGESGSLLSASTPMEQALDRKVTVHLDGVNLDDFILAIGSSEDVNIIADGLDATGTMTVHAEGVPLSEILDYVSRNLGIAFYVGENIIWATKRDQGLPAVPLETRVYRLRKGISGDELGEDVEKIDIVEAIERFIPEVEGSDRLFNKKAHVLIVKDTRQNLAKIEEIIESLDVCPPQVLIEARFISTSVADLRELGIDWLLNSPLAVTEKRVLRNGVEATETHTQVDTGAAIEFVPFAGAAQGMNFTYQGLLTDPMFQAVLHALDVSGKSRTLSVPKITTVNNKPAQIRIGEDFRYFQEYDIQSVPSDVTSEGSTVYSSVLVPVGLPQLEELGIQLDVTPSVGADMGSITLHMVPEISEFVRYEHYEIGSGNSSDDTTNATSLVKLPIFRRSKIETELIVQSGETVVMGGLISSTESKTRNAVPILSSIPLVGRLFRHDGVEESKQNLLIFVTASILSERGESLIPMIEPAAQPVAE